jgi:hypothetical protein
MKAILIFKSLLVLSVVLPLTTTKMENRSLRLAKTSHEKIAQLEEQLERIQEAQKSLQEKNAKKSLDKKETETAKSTPLERRLEDENQSTTTNTISHSFMHPFGGMMTPSLLPPPPPIFSTGKLPVTTQYHIVHYPSHVNTPWNLLSYPRVMAPHYGYMGYPLHPYNYMHMAHAAHTAMLGASMGMPGAFANPYMYSPYSMGLHPFGYLPPVGMPYMPHASYGLGGFSSPFPYGVYGSFGYDSSMMNSRKKKKRARKLKLKKKSLV